MEIDQYEQRNQRQWYKKDIASYDFMLSPSASNPSTLHQDNHYPYKPNQQAPASQPTANMQFIITILALATAATALPATSQVVDATGFDNYHGEQVLISLPTGCTNADLAKCVLHLVGTTGSCGAAVIEFGANPVADLSCIGSAASTAANFDECKSCIPQ